MSLRPKKIKRKEKAHKRTQNRMTKKTLSVEDIELHWKKQGGKLRGYQLDFVKLYVHDGVITIGIEGPKGKIQMDAYDKIKRMFSKCEFAGGGGYVGVGSWSNLRPSIYVDVMLDSELIDLDIRKREEI